MRRGVGAFLFVLLLAGVARAEEGRLVAHVADAEGKPIADAGVMVWSEDDMWSGLTDAAGVWRQALPPGRYAAIIRAEGRVGAEKHDLVVVAGRETDARWSLEPGVAFRGRVLDPQGQPVPGAAVTVVPGGSFEGWNEVYPGRGPFAREWTGAEGGFEVGGIPMGAIATVVVEAEGFREARVGIRAGEDGVRPSPLEIVLGTGAHVSGRVVDEKGAGVAEAVVYVVPAAFPQMRKTPTLSIVAEGELVRALTARTNATGWFRVENLAPGTAYVVVVDAEGFARHAESEPFEVEEEGGSFEITVTVRAGATLVARVFGEDETPIRDANLVLGSHIGATSLEASEGDGAYRFHDVPPGRHALHVKREGFLDAVVAVEATAGETVEVVIPLERGVLLRGVLVDEAGRPAPGIGLGVEVRTKDPVTGWTTWSSAMDESDAEGRFEIGPLAAGTYEIEAFSTRFELLRAPRVVVPSEGLRLEGRWMGTATMRLLRPDGTPYEGTVWVWRSLPDDLGGAIGSGVEVTDGRLALDEIRAAPATIELVPEGFAPFERTLQARSGEELDLGEVVLDPGHTVVGRVLTPEGAPAAEAVVRLGRQRVESAADGSFALEHVPAGTAILELRADGWAKSWPRVTVGPDVEGVVLTLSRGTRVRVVVRDAQGAVLPGARVAIDRLVDGAWRDAAVGTANEEGFFEGPVPAGRVRFTLLEVDEDGDARLGPVLEELELVEGGERELVLILPDR